jgi:hypothetical protein
VGEQFVGKKLFFSYLLIFVLFFFSFFLLTSELSFTQPQGSKLQLRLRNKRRAQVKAWPYFPQKKNLSEALNQGMYSYANLSFPHDISWTVDTAGIFEPQDTT